MDYAMRLVPERVKSLPVHMDFVGQKKAERMFQFIILLFGLVGFIWGYMCQQFSQTMCILLAGVALSCILTLPPWGMYRKSPLQWQKARPEVCTGESPPPAITPAASSQQKSKKKK